MVSNSSSKPWPAWKFPWLHYFFTHSHKTPKNMKKTMAMILTTVITAGLFSAVLFTACTKSSPNPCSGVACYNGGACVNGTCSCTTGWTGTNCQTAVNTSIVYQNNTFTPVNIVYNGVSQVIPVGGSITYTGAPNSNLTATATTSGTTTTGTQIGTLISWNLSNTFPATGTSTLYLDVSSSFFFLKIRNTNLNYSTNTVYVNYGLTAQTTDYLAIPNNGVVYNTGYYNAYTNTEIYILSYPSGTYWTNYPSFSYVINQYYTLTLY